MAEGLNESLHAALTQQFNEEFYSSYLYLAMSAYCESQNLPGFAHWMRAQAKEEQEHAMKFLDFIQDRNGRVTLGAVQQPPADFGTPLEIMEKSLEHERYISGRIHQLLGLATELQDYPTQVFLHWFVSEQVEEERTVGQLVDTLKAIGNNQVGILMLDRELAQRE